MATPVNTINTVDDDNVVIEQLLPHQVIYGTQYKADYNATHVLVQPDQIDQIVQNHGLNVREALFAEYYITTMNASKAARMAGYANAGMGSVLLQRHSIKRYLALRFVDAKITANEILARLAHIARASITDFLDDAGNFTIKNALADDVNSSAIKSYKRITRYAKDGAITTTEEIELHNPLTAMDLLGTNLRLWAATDDKPLAMPTVHNVSDDVLVYLAQQALQANALTHDDVHGLLNDDQSV